MLWRKIRKGIKDPVFITSLKFGVGIFVFPFFYFALGALIYLLADSIAALLWLIISIPSMLFLRNPPPE